MGPIHAGDPVSLLAGIVSACIGLLIAIPIIVLLVRERRVTKARDAQWDEATQRERDLLNAIYERRTELRDRLGELEPGDFKREMGVAAAYDHFIDAAWAARHAGGLEEGRDLADDFLATAAELDGSDLVELEQLQLRIDRASDAFRARRRALEASPPTSEID